MSKLAIKSPEILGSEILKNVCDQFGKPRLAESRLFFIDEFCQENVPMITRVFKLWRDFHEALIIKGVHRETGEEIRLALKCSKRGNDVFASRMEKKIGFLRSLDGISFFSPQDFDKNPTMPSNLLWFTHTFDPKICSIKDAWLGRVVPKIHKSGKNEGLPYPAHANGCPCIMCSWNSFITNLRNKYGRISYLRFIEAFPNPKGSAFGYPHLHTIVMFHDVSFNAFPNIEKLRDGSMGVAYRIVERNQVRSQGKWHSFVDIKAISSSRSLGDYLRKHTKNTHYGDTPGALTTQALLWLFRKQTFSMSSDFKGKLSEFIKGMHDSKNNLAQETLDGDVVDVWIWSCYGVRSYLELNMDPEVWVQSLSKKEFADAKVWDRDGYK